MKWGTAVGAWDVRQIGQQERDAFDLSCRLRKDHECPWAEKQQGREVAGSGKTEKWRDQEETGLKSDASRAACRRKTGSDRLAYHAHGNIIKGARVV